METVYELTELWKNSIKGEEHSFALLHKSLYPCLFNYAVKVIKDDELVDDLLQDVFLKVWQNRLQIQSISSVRAYFYRSVRGVILAHINRNQLSEFESITETELEFSKEDVMLSPEINAEVRRSIVSELNKLPARQREVIYMHFHDKLEHTQIAEIIGTKYKSVVNDAYPASLILREASTVKDIYAV